ncbi:MAG TPA: FliM/FliN family flagellar motor switch protein [Acidobacteriota bacterium]|nr:FliM/FliN family flagellar motor switch protein [Acidobacteriota bacterium]
MSGKEKHSENIQRILDIELPITVSFGSTTWPLKDILEMTSGSVLELDRAADDPVVLRINERPFAHGEVVVVDGYYGIKILQIDSPEDRIHSLGG